MKYPILNLLTPILSSCEPRVQNDKETLNKIFQS